MDALYNDFKMRLFKGGTDLEQENVNVLLVSDDYKFDASHENASSINGELSGAGYEEGGYALSGVKVSFKEGKAIFMAENLLLKGVKAGTAAGLVLCIWKNNKIESPLIAFIDSIDIFPINTNGGDLVLKWPDTGIIKI